MHRLTIPWPAAAVAGVLASAWGCTADRQPPAGPAAPDGSQENVRPAMELWEVMGTFASVSVPESDRGRLAACTSAAQGIFRDLDAALSAYKPQSELSRLNRSPSGRLFHVSPRTREVLALSLKYARVSGGSFDPTISPLIRLWGFNEGTAPDRVPDQDALDEALRPVGFERVNLSESGVRFELPGMSVDLAGIAKGYAVDVAYRELVSRGAPDVMVNLGGNIRCRGFARQGRPWKVGVRNPFDRDEIVGVLDLTGGLAVATSGNYERFVTIEGERYAHIVDPRSGRPVKGMAGVTVISDAAAEADAMSTALFVLGPEEAPPVLERLEQCHALWIPDRRPIELLASPGFSRFFAPDPRYSASLRVVGD